MSYDAILTALADPTRRAILDQLRGGALPVGQIAEALPVTRPAVSQHLKVMADAGLLTMTRDGRRNLYGLAVGGASALVDWLGELSAPVSQEVATGLHRSLTVRLSPAETWHLFCEDMALWWPVAEVSFSARRGGSLPQAIFLDLSAGVLREVLTDGTDGIWAKVLAVDPGERLLLDWRLGASGGSEVEVRVLPEAGGARLVLTDSLDTPETADLWDLVLMERFAAAAASSLSNF